MELVIGVSYWSEMIPTVSRVPHLHVPSLLLEYNIRRHFPLRTQKSRKKSMKLLDYQPKTT